MGSDSAGAAGAAAAGAAVGAGAPPAAAPLAALLPALGGAAVFTLYCGCDKLAVALLVAAVPDEDAGTAATAAAAGGLGALGARGAAGFLGLGACSQTAAECNCMNHMIIKEVAGPDSRCWHLQSTKVVV